MAAPSRRSLEVNGLTPTQALKESALRKRMLPLVLRAKALGVAALYGKPSAARPLQPRAPQSQDKRPPSAALGSSQRKMPKLEIKL